MTRATSVSSYRREMDRGAVMTQEELILGFMSKMTPAPRDWTLKELSRALRLEINAVSGRVNGLKKAGDLIECPKRECRITGRMVTPVRVHFSIALAGLHRGDEQ